MLDGSGVLTVPRLKATSREFDVTVKTSGATDCRITGTAGSPPVLQAANAQKESLEKEYETRFAAALGTCGALSVPVVNIDAFPNRWIAKTPPVMSTPAELLTPVKSRRTTVSVVKGVPLSAPIGFALQPAGQVLVIPHGFAEEF
jgi:hypothetical protein